jgi:hypothetical protein
VILSVIEKFAAVDILASSEMAMRVMPLVSSYETSVHVYTTTDKGCAAVPKSCLTRPQEDALLPTKADKFRVYWGHWAVWTPANP